MIRTRFLAAVLAGGLALTMGAVAYAAGYSYIPTPSPVPPGTPGGFHQVITTKTVPPILIREVVVAARVDGSPVKVLVPPHAFPVPVQMVVTQPNLKAITRSLRAKDSKAYKGYHALAGTGVSVVTMSGHLYAKKFLKPLVVIIVNKAIRRGDRVVEWNAQGKLIVLPPWVAHKGRAIRFFEVDPAFAVLAPNR